MISPITNNTSTDISVQLFSVFEDIKNEISTLAQQAPETIVEPVHIIRKRLKFLRAFVKLTQFCSGGEDYKEINFILRDCGRMISDCRDAHVRSLLLEEFKQEHPGNDLIDERIDLNNYQTKGIENELLSGKNTFDEIIAQLDSKPVTGYFSSLNCQTESLLEGYTLGYQKSYNAFHSELTAHEAHLLHEWRKRTKDLQYQMESLADTISAELPPSLQEVSELNDILGRINDLFMFSHWLSKSEKTESKIKDVPKLIDLIHTQIDSLEKQADVAGHSLYRFPPEEYQDKLKTTIMT